MLMSVARLGLFYGTIRLINEACQRSNRNAEYLKMYFYFIYIYSLYCFVRSVFAKALKGCTRQWADKIY